jgi:hypothetical protein
LSATDLVRLTLWNISSSGYISPEVIVTGLAALANLRFLNIGFVSDSYFSCPDRENRRPPPPTRTVLPALNRFWFQGVSEYSEDFVARIDAPLLDSIWITFFHELIDVPQLAQLMKRTTRFQALNEAHVVLSYHIIYGHIGVQVKSLPRTSDPGLKISCRQSISSVAQDFTLFFSSIYMVEHLYIYGPHWPGYSEHVEWLEIFHPFTAVKNLYVCKEFAERIGPPLQELVGERVTDVLYALERLFLEEFQPSGPIQEDIGKFIAARQLSSHPMTVSLWERDLDRD